MSNRGFSDDGTVNDVPWASVFDPAANARALSAIQAEGFRAASRIVDRFVNAVGPSANGEAAGTSADAVEDNPAVDGRGAVDGLGEFERFTRAWWSMAGQFLLRSMPTTATAPGSGSVSLDVNSPNGAGSVSFDAAVGGSASAEVWLHNRGADDRGDVRLHCSDLLSHDGNVVRASAVDIDTDVVTMSRRSSRGVAITIDVGAEIRPGVYRGTLLAGGHPDLWLPVVLTVRMPGT
ncbi:MAG: hypothetical protein WB777_04120 [Mycobacterium sp.]